MEHQIHYLHSIQPILSFCYYQGGHQTTIILFEIVIRPRYNKDPRLVKTMYASPDALPQHGPARDGNVRALVPE